MARVEEARRPALGRRLAGEARLRRRHRPAALLQRGADRGEVLRPARARPSAPRPRCSARRRGRSRPCPAGPRSASRTSTSSARMSSPSATRSSRALRFASANSAASRARRLRRPTNSAAPPAPSRPSRIRPPVPAPSPSPPPLRSSPTRSVKSSRIASQVAALALDRVRGELAGLAAVEHARERPDLPPGDDHVGAGAAVALRDLAQRLGRIAAGLARDLLRHDDDVHRPGALVGDPVAQLGRPARRSASGRRPGRRRRCRSAGRRPRDRSARPRAPAPGRAAARAGATRGTAARRITPPRPRPRAARAAAPCRCPASPAASPAPSVRSASP